jgi:hypothetical protein
MSDQLLTQTPFGVDFCRMKTLLLTSMSNDSQREEMVKHPDITSRARIMLEPYIQAISVRLTTSGVPRNFRSGGGVSTNSFQDRGQRERVSGGGSP